MIGVNIGRNRDGDVEDYPAAARAVASVADYIAINVSSPNTPGLRDLQDPERLAELLSAVEAAAPGRPLLVKLSPDLTHAQRARLLQTLETSPAAGAVMSNTATSRSGIRLASAEREGGLSGRPLRAGTLAAIGQARSIAGERLAIGGSGGIAGADDVESALRAGADLVQLWTGMVYGGAGVIGEAVTASLAR